MSQFDDLNALDFNLNYGHFNPDEIQTDETINAVFVVDISPSVASYASELNYAFNDFVQSMQKSHVADRLLVSVIEFNEKIKARSGFQPIAQVPATQFVPSGSGTALYDAAGSAIKTAMDYRQNLEASGVMTKTLIFVITDGEDNSSKGSAKQVFNALQKIRSEEKNAFSFVTIMFGVGTSNSFEKAQKDMGFQHLARVGQTGADMKKMIGFISQSISGAANGNIQF
ncbi:MAG: hypothetical protein EAZ57_03330 [Cytophagales bacterium]|nr:MAG: hypothetical protein EAZ67_03795 [Cytophagales bacterium]TAF61495.1 MAG: hypothetical protein EAZ57_03330 [Cytophagales bacterium]